MPQQYFSMTDIPNSDSTQGQKNDTSSDDSSGESSEYDDLFEAKLNSSKKNKRRSVRLSVKKSGTFTEDLSVEIFHYDFTDFTELLTR